MKIRSTATAALLCTLAAGAVQAQEELRIGVVASLSGPAQPWGAALARAAEMAAEEANSKGYEVGGKRYRIKVIPYDGKGRPDEALAVVNRLIRQDKVKFILGPQASGDAIATQSLTTSSKVITFTIGWSPRLLGPEQPYQFRPHASFEEILEPMVEWTGKRLKVKKIGGLFPNDELGQQAAKQIRSAYEKVGTSANIELFEKNRVDFVPLLTRLMNQGIDGIDLDGNAPTIAGLIVKQARGLGFKGAIVRSGGPAEDEIVQVAGKEAAEGIYMMSPINTNDPAIQDFTVRYKAKFNGEFNGFVPANYDSMRLLLDSIRRAGTVDDTDAVVKAAIETRDFPGITGKLNWTGKARYGIDRQIQTNFYITQIRDGKSGPVARCDYTTCNDIK